jgi:hypothetical protein
VWIAELLDEWQPTLIKGNAAEIRALTDSNEVGQEGQWRVVEGLGLQTRAVGVRAEIKDDSLMYNRKQMSCFCSRLKRKALIASGASRMLPMLYARWRARTVRSLILRVTITDGTN